jgi:NTE family protein
MGRTILVLGGGGMKGLAHVGAWQALEEAGIEVAEVVGTSIGALVAAAVAGGLGWREIVPRALELKKESLILINRWALLPMGIRQASIFNDSAFRALIAASLPVERFDELQLPVSINAVDLETGHTEWFGAGGRTDVSLAEAVYASCALPVFFPPARIEDRYFVDGGVGDTLPVTWAAERGADRIVAVDVAAGQEKDPADTVSKGLVAIHHRVYDIMAHAKRADLLARWSGPPLTYVRPRLDGYSTFDFNATQYFLEEGYRATRQALAQAEQQATES